MSESSAVLVAPEKARDVGAISGSRRLIWLLLALSAVLGFARLLDVGNAPFINDEPNFQLMLDGHLKNHTFPLLTLLGSQGVSYGPTALWIYYPLRLFTSNVSAIVFYFAMIFCIGLGLMIRTVWRSEGPRVGAWMAALITSSPFLFFYSRLPWDNTFLVVLVAWVAFSIVRLDRRQNLVDCGALGIACGLIVNLHLMGLPVLAAAGLTLAPTFLRRMKRSASERKAVLFGVGFAGLTFGFVVLPYLLAVWNALAGGSHFDPFMPRLGWGLKNAFRFFSWSGMNYFFDQPQDYRDAIFPFALAKIYRVDPSWLLKGASIIALGLTGRRLWKNPESVTALQRFGLFSFVIIYLYYAGLAVDFNHPHYFMPIWWVAVFFGVLAIVHSKGWVRSVLSASAALTVLMNVVFVFSAYSWILQNHGTRGIHYGPVHRELEQNVSEICADAQSSHSTFISIDFDQVIGVFPPGVEYDFSHQKSCTGLELLERDDPRSAAVPRYVLDYRNPKDDYDAELTWKRERS